jgi:exopolysaccharide biosynthesis protein
MVSDLERRHPRTAIGVRPTGEVLLVTVDGRSAAGAGVTLAELARLLIVLGCDRAMNLDGGGSTTMWIARQPDDGVVSYPSDDGNGDHRGERRVANALCVFAR